MREKDLENKRLDAAMKSILRAAAASDAEIDEIAAKPFTYAAVRAQIDTGSRTVKRRLIPVFAFASLVLVAFIAAGVYVFSGDDAGRQISVAPLNTPDAPKMVSADRPTAFGPAIIPVAFKTGKVKTVIRKRNVRKNLRAPKKVLQRTESPDLADTFFALDYQGVVDEAVGGGRVVRVNVPRASLFAMGVNVPLENEAASVVADVMLGPDGVARAIRLVE